MPAHRHPLRLDKVYRAILSRIAMGDFRPGTRVSPALLAQRFRVSTTPVREALCRLAGRDIVEERHGDGFYLGVLDEPVIAGLYALHDHVLAQALDKWPAPARFRPRRALWALFAQIGRNSGDRVLADIEAYLADRLHIVRRHERLLIGEMAATAGTLGEALCRNDVDAARNLCRVHHRRCIEAAGRLASFQAAPRP